VPPLVACPQSVLRSTGNKAREQPCNTQQTSRPALQAVVNTSCSSSDFRFRFALGFASGSAFACFFFALAPSGFLVSSFFFRCFRTAGVSKSSSL
jgi:hypothetical protein